MRNKRMAAEAYFAAQACGFRSGLCAVKPVALINDCPFYTIQSPEEVEMPPGAAELTVGYSLQANLFLLLHELNNFGVLYFLQLPGANFAVLEF
ncbi:hypothetical protein D3C81_1651370 [compost metagenome]